MFNTKIAMQCLLIYFTILGFHLVVSYPKIQTNYRIEESQPKNQVKPELLQNENYPNQQYETKLNGERPSKLDQIIEVSEATYHTQDVSSKDETLKNNNDKSEVEDYDQEFNGPQNYQDKSIDDIRHQIYLALQTYHSPHIKVNSRYEPENYASSFHIYPASQLDKHQEDGDNHRYKDESAYTSTGDSYYEANEYYTHPDYGLDLEFNQGYGHQIIYPSEHENGIHHDLHHMNWDPNNYEDDFEYPKVSHTESTKTDDQSYIDKYFKPEYIVPIQSTTNNLLQKSELNEDLKTFSTRTPGNLKWVEHIEENGPHDNVINLQKTIFDDDNTKHTTEVKKVTTTELTTVKDETETIPHNCDSLDEPIYEDENTEVKTATTSKHIILQDKVKLENEPHDDNNILDLHEKPVPIKGESSSYTNEVKSITKPKDADKLANVPNDGNITELSEKDKSLNDTTKMINVTTEAEKNKLETVVPVESTTSPEDLPHMKPISEPLIWFRPDGNFWQKVQNGETTYDKVVFLQVRPTAVIERHTNEFHYENGTVIKDHYEAVWEHEDDPSPKEIITKRVIEHPDGSTSII